VQVVTGFPNFPTGDLAPGYGVRRRLDERDGTGVAVRRVALYPSHDGSPVKRALNYTSFALSASVSGVGVLRDVDAVWVYNSPATVGLPSMLASWRNGPPHLMHVMDLWPDSLAFSGLTGGRVYQAMAAVLHRWCRVTYRGAAAIACISRGILDELVARGVPPERLHYIPVWTDEEIYRPLPYDTALARQLGVEGRFTVLYAGNLGGAQSLDGLLETAARLQHLDNLRFLIAGSGTEAERLRRRASHEGLVNVRFLGRWPAEDMGRLMAVSDLNVVSLSTDPLSEIAMPSKLPNILATARPVLGWAAGEVARIVREAGAGRTVKPGDVDGFADVLATMYRSGQEQMRRLGERGEHYYGTRLSLNAGVAAVENLLEEIVRRKAHRSNGTPQQEMLAR
jgi:glycosyltransferase involved in cell wall biosynthesis